MLKKMAVIFSILLLLTGCSSSLKLQYKGEPGEVRQYKMNTNLEQNVEMMGNEVNNNVEMAYFLTQKIQSAEKDGSLKMTFTYDSLTFDASGAQMGAMKDVLLKRIKKMKGIEIDFKISNKGDVLEFTKIDSLIPQQLRQFINPRQSFSAFLPGLPEMSIKIGDSWQDKNELPIKSDKMDMKLISDNKLTLLGKEQVDRRELLKIKSVGTIEMEGKLEQGGMNVFMEGDGDSKGEFLFDNSNGLYYSGSSETEMDMTVALTGQQTMTIPMTQIIKVEIKKIK